MRIIAGTYKGKRLYAPKGLPVRPTTDFAKEGLFNILNNRFDLGNIKVLDLYTGTGNISYEFASRGAIEVVSIDSHFGCVKYVQKVADELKMPITTFKSEAHKYIAHSKEKFDIIFADPPYDIEIEKISSIIDNIYENKLLNTDGIFIIEHTKHIDLSSLKNYDNSRRYGGSVFSFFISNL